MFGNVSGRRLMRRYAPKQRFVGHNVSDCNVSGRRRWRRQFEPRGGLAHRGGEAIAEEAMRGTAM